jgi:hypothetical protein
VTDAQGEVREARAPLDVLLGLWGASLDWKVGGALAEDPRSGLEAEQLEQRALGASLDLAELGAHAARGATRWPGGMGGALPLPSAQAWWPSTKRAAAAGAGPLDRALAADLRHRRGRARIGEASCARSSRARFALAVETRAAARFARRGASRACGERADYLRDVHLPLHDGWSARPCAIYNAMQIGAFDVLAARRQEIRAARERLVTLREAWKTRLDLEQLLAGGLDRSACGPRCSSTRRTKWSRMGQLGKDTDMSSSRRDF